MKAKSASYDRGSPAQPDELLPAIPTKPRLRPQYDRWWAVSGLVGLFLGVACFLALFFLARRLLGYPVRPPAVGFVQALRGLILSALTVLLLLPASLILGVLTAFEIVRRVLVLRGVVPCLSLRDVLSGRGLPEHWYTTEPPEVEPRLKPRYAAVVESVQLAVGLFTIGIGGLASFAAGEAIRLDWNARLQGTPGASATSLFLLVTFLGGFSLTYLAIGWLVARGLVRRGLLSRGDLRGFLLGTRYPPEWCTTEPLHRPVSRPLRESFKFSVRGLAGFVALVAIGLSLVVSSTRSERSSVAAVEARGATVFYDWRYSPVNRLVGIPHPWWQRWSEQCGLGSPLSARLVIAPKATDGDLTLVGRLGGLHALDLSRSAVTDSGLSRLAALADVQALYLDGTPVTDNGLAHLARMARLRCLSLRKTQVGDKGMTHLWKHPELWLLDLGGTDLGDSGLARLAALHRLDTLNLCQTRVTDAGLVHMKNFKNLNWLALSGAGVTDAGLRQLKSVPSLRTLLLLNSSVTDAGVADLRQAMPGLNVIRKSRSTGKETPVE